MEKKETRGRPATGRKQYKHIGIRLDEATFNLYENLALENGAESLPVFIKANLSKIFDDEITGPLVELEELRAENKKLKKIIAGINKVLNDI